MTAANYLANARKNLEALEQLLRQAAREKWPAERIEAPAMDHLRQTRQILDSLLDDEGTE